MATLERPTRDRFVDLLRAVSILVVVLGHWTMAAFTLQPGADGTEVLRVGNVMSATPALQPLTWLAQVMPLFFVAAGFANARALRGHRSAAKTSVADFLIGRAERVGRPTVVFVAVWTVGSTVAIAAGAPLAVVTTAGRNAAMVLWFLAVYLLLAALAPLQHRLTSRLTGSARWLPFVLAPVLVALLDQTQNTTWAALGFVNYLLVFVFCQQLGFAYADGALTGIARRWWVGGIGVALIALLLLTGPGPYPVSMIDLPGQDMSNMLPPSVVVIAVAVLQISIAMLIRPAALRWLERPAVWAVVAGVNLRVMTLFLWHITALVLVIGMAMAMAVSFPEPGTGTWWLRQLGWIAAACVVTALLIVVFGPVEARGLRRSRPSVTGWWTSRAGAVAAGVGTVVVAAGMAMVASAGFAEPLRQGGIPLAGLTFAPVWGLAALALGYLLIRGISASPRSGLRGTPRH